VLDMAGWTRPWQPGRLLELSPGDATPVRSASGSAPAENGR
jgi:hypothetical protein